MCAYEYLYFSFAAPPQPFPIWIYGHRAEGLRICYVSAETAWSCVQDPPTPTPLLLFQQTRQISLLGDAVNLNFISKIAVEKPRAGEKSS